MLNRRELLARGSKLLVCVPVLAACSSKSYGQQQAQGPDAGACNGIDATSSIAESHDHVVCVATSDLTNPPAAGVTYTTSSVSEHTHTVALTKAQLASINSGATVTVTTSSVVDPLDGVAHTHQFAIHMA